MYVDDGLVGDLDVNQEVLQKFKSQFKETITSNLNSDLVIQIL